ncbi:MAG: hypothetical protein A3J50_00490 [Candidatus Woykebacteria bacterium RIFCSPHIGHO2_02_FULL_43_16b]|uniref:Uncharacterized protein n=1 Tax=Candidatus Woykebacteria bacterium RIFCSPHIGHO2_02_FULL_43_16b TaxID=1802601 RepID=A0A1G1WSL1_9BACT|nr:MAG: hypothetical protein A3J50_00490 [Candidatus Woykebacteria bacterium RIFCSPHIGHO2_02_FULL_43_16b]
MATIKQKLVASNLLENTGKSVSQAMKEAGYKEGSYKNPQQLTRSRGWAELMDQFLPEKLLLHRLKQLLNKKITYWIGKGDNRKLIRTKEIDSASVAKALDMAYKIRGKYQIGIEELNRDARSEAMWERLNRLLPDADL